MKKVSYFSLSPTDSTSFYRTSGVLPFIKHDDFILEDISKKEVNWATLIDTDILILQRPFVESHVDFIKLAKDIGIKIILDYDDLLTAIDELNPAYDLYHSNQFCLKMCISLADEIWVSTIAIKEAFSEWNKNIYVIPNSHNNHLFALNKKRKFSGKKKILWRGSPTHKSDIYEVADEIVNLVNDNKDWNFEFIGDRFTYLEQRCGNNMVLRTHMSLMQYFKHIHKLNPSITFFPLANTPMNEAKSNISYLESVYCGSAFVANGELTEFSNCHGFDYQHVGLERTMNAAMGDMEACENLNRMAWEHIKDTLLLSDINKLRVNRILENL